CASWITDATRSNYGLDSW
nr:immunoglobulin heavy chain junction region [Macaca mulatta]MOV43562.1 immunoglobulin heavy chain junction region [Macaca mulatta]MOV44005.1 immunoglobulin heavy chain junction region [Macaca mulatta]MOV44713.1 immunoglobulin heavy chain junction region [Macaca mulatta]MOV47237.1 immunoglobulin heavy chain junction region [Macaca mulatta]